MKKYIYSINELNRISDIYEATEENIKKFFHYEEIDLSDEDFEKIINNPYYGLIDNQIILIPETEEEILAKKESDRITIFSKINSIKIKLAETDYQVIKCYEAQLLQEEMPYNLQELLAQRKAWREEINAIEFEISMLA
jgi:hypothetical protein